jgi:hypothetical protein
MATIMAATLTVVATMEMRKIKRENEFFFAFAILRAMKNGRFNGVACMLKYKAFIDYFRTRSFLHEVSFVSFCSEFVFCGKVDFPAFAR